MSATLLTMALGILIPMLPAVISLLLPRATTIAYARKIRKIISLFLRQRGETILKNKAPVEKSIGAFESTIEDFTFGLYIEGRNLSDEVKTQKIADYLKETKNGL
jgi:hypothetical protein